MKIIISIILLGMSNVIVAGGPETESGSLHTSTTQQYNADLN